MPKGGIRKGAGRKPGPPASTKGVRLPDETWESLDYLSRKLGRPRNHLIAWMIDRLAFVARADEKSPYNEEIDSF